MLSWFLPIVDIPLTLTGVFTEDPEGTWGSLQYRTLMICAFGTVISGRVVGDAGKRLFCLAERTP